MSDDIFASVGKLVHNFSLTELLLHNLAWQGLGTSPGRRAAITARMSVSELIELVRRLNKSGAYDQNAGLVEEIVRRLAVLTTEV